MLINPEGSPFYIFRHYATFLKKKFQKFQFFSKKNLLRFLSLRYGADFRRSRLVVIFFDQKSHHLAIQACLHILTDQQN